MNHTYAGQLNCFTQLRAQLALQCLLENAVRPLRLNIASQYCIYRISKKNSLCWRPAYVELLQTVSNVLSLYQTEGAEIQFF